MGQRIPDPIRQQAIKKWLEGRSRDRIAHELKISQGVVSDIMKEAGKDDPQYLLLRDVAVRIKNQGMDIESFASLVRLRAVLRDKGVLTGSSGQENLELMQDRLEAAIVNMEVILFQKGLTPEDFFSLVTNMYNSADNIGVSPNDFPSYIEKLKDEIDVLTKKINQAEKKKQDFSNFYKTTLESVQEYNANKPILIRIQNLKEKLADAEGKKHELEEKLAYAEGKKRELEEGLHNKKRSNDLGEQNTGSVFETELEKAKEEFLPSMEMPYSMSMIKDILKNPGRYMGVISQMSDIYDRYHGIPGAN
jgi:hypothetical protein